MNNAIDEEQFDYGYQDYVEGRPRPDEGTDVWFLYGWFRAQEDAGLDPVSLGKLRNQLEALGFSPNPKH